MDFFSNWLSDDTSQTVVLVFDKLVFRLRRSSVGLLSLLYSTNGLNGRTKATISRPLGFKACFIFLRNVRGSSQRSSRLRQEMASYFKISAEFPVTFESVGWVSQFCTSKTLKVEWNFYWDPYLFKPIFTWKYILILLVSFLSKSPLHSWGHLCGIYLKKYNKINK